MRARTLAFAAAWIASPRWLVLELLHGIYFDSWRSLEARTHGLTPSPLSFLDTHVLATPLQATVQALAFAPNDAYAVSAAHAERHIVAWHTAAAPSKKRRQAAGLISLQQPVTALCTCAALEDSTDDFQVGCSGLGVQDLV